MKPAGRQSWGTRPEILEARAIPKLQVPRPARYRLCSCFNKNLDGGHCCRTTRRRVAVDRSDTCSAQYFLLKHTHHQSQLVTRQTPALPTMMTLNRCMRRPSALNRCASCIHSHAFPRATFEFMSPRESHVSYLTSLRRIPSCFMLS